MDRLLKSPDTTFVKVACSTLLSLGAAGCVTSRASTAKTVERTGDAAKIAVASKYLDAYATLNVERMASMYAEDATFIDPTSENAPGVPQTLHFTGRDTIVGVLGEYAKNYRCLRYDFDRVYESGDCVVFVGRITAQLQADPKPLTLRSSIVTIVTVKDGRVAEHRDYYDYQGVEQSTDKGDVCS